MLESAPPRPFHLSQSGVWYFGRGQVDVLLDIVQADKSQGDRPKRFLLACASPAGLQFWSYGRVRMPSLTSPPRSPSGILLE